jgi:hypothetical protein
MIEMGADDNVFVFVMGIAAGEDPDEIFRTRCGAPFGGFGAHGDGQREMRERFFGTEKAANFREGVATAKEKLVAALGVLNQPKLGRRRASHVFELHVFREAGACGTRPVLRRWIGDHDGANSSRGGEVSATFLAGLVVRFDGRRPR